MARPRKDDAKAGTRQRIIDVYWELAKERAFRAISVDQIIARAQCNRTTFYYHFNNLAEVRTRAEDQHLNLENFTPVARALFSSQEVSTVNLREFYAQNTDLLRYLSRQLSEDRHGATSHSFRRLLWELWTALGIIDASAAWSVEDMTDADIMRPAYLFASGGLAELLASLVDVDDYALERRLDAYSVFAGEILANAMLTILGPSKANQD